VGCGFGAGGVSNNAAEDVSAVMRDVTFGVHFAGRVDAAFGEQLCFDDFRNMLLDVSTGGKLGVGLPDVELRASDCCDEMDCILEGTC
jgi:hypothetical protein